MSPRIHSAARRDPSPDSRSNFCRRPGQQIRQRVGRLLDHCTKRVATVFKKVVARIKLLGKCENSQIQVASQKKLERPISRVLPRRVSVIHQDDPLGQSLKRPQMIFSQGRSQRADHVANANLMSGDDVGITLDHPNPTRFAAGIPCQVRRVDQSPFVKQKRLGAVQVLSDVLPLAVASFCSISGRIRPPNPIARERSS